MAIDADTLARAQRGDAAAIRELATALAPAVLARVHGDRDRAIAALGSVVADLPRYALGAERLEAWAVTRAGKRASSTADADADTAPSPPNAAAVAAVVDGAVAAAATRPADAPPVRRRAFEPGIVAAVIAIACIVALVVAFVRTTPAPERGPSSGDVSAQERVTVPIYRGVAVLAPGAAIAWSGGRVEHKGGIAFYRIEPGALVTIATAAGTVTTASACLHVSVDAAARTTTVTIDEGDAMIGTRKLPAGATATLPDAPPRR
jgi:hypothetical protein